MQTRTINRDSLSQLMLGTTRILYVFDFDSTLFPPLYSNSDISSYVLSISHADVQNLSSLLQESLNLGNHFGILSNNYQDSIINVLKSLNLLHFFSFVIGGNYHNDPKIFKLQDIKNIYGSIIFIDDNFNQYLEAYNSDIPALRFVGNPIVRDVGQM
ncbi:HAD Haloacid dehalogenase-like hydrolase [Orpheovirus IHUMI-LCC2]|uniref:HAD Haloacid dehalogenase-like hydrolase n=1 Tax=Orpheovirus IHUMI-LCC2 TaxID=2023057 RepID=A0A2I2L5Y7_9VIRU|nr:HAD Haloacid dehalogenase-like hydrolase [Orpheovirus IHUMI-LCC2]SNW62968.1 HAD Haloacid dehalogenase-like hydrolase [Orpheovirus IHUMI-LCC2]